MSKKSNRKVRGNAIKGSEEKIYSKTPLYIPVEDNTRDAYIVATTEDPVVRNWAQAHHDWLFKGTLELEPWNNPFEIARNMTQEMSGPFMVQAADIAGYNPLTDKTFPVAKIADEKIRQEAANIMVFLKHHESYRESFEYNGLTIGCSYDRLLMEEKTPLYLQMKYIDLGILILYSSVLIYAEDMKEIALPEGYFVSGNGKKAHRNNVPDTYGEVKRLKEMILDGRIIGKDQGHD